VRRGTFSLVSSGKLKWLEGASLARRRWLLHAFSTRAGGISRVASGSASALNLGFIETDKRTNVEKNRGRFFRALGAEDWPLAGLRQIHSSNIFLVVKSSQGGLEYRPSGYYPPRAPDHTPPQGDALLTHEPGVLLSVRSADCLPVLLADVRRRAVAAVHAGWRGALAGIIEKAVGEMVRIFGSSPSDLVAAIGPSIRACCYEVGDEVVSAFCGRYPNGEEFFRSAPQDKAETEIARRHPLLFLSKQPPGHGPDSTGKKHLDLVAVARYQLRRAGLSPTHIAVADYCTACRTDLFFSHRREGSGTGRTMTVIGIEPLDN